MRIMVAGNSQAGALRVALREGFLGDDRIIQPEFYVVPGGTGPAFILKNRRLVVTSFNEMFPPYQEPPDVAERPLDHFDVVLVSALGYVDGGFMYENPIPEQGYVAEFSPREGRPDRPLISCSCLADIIRPALESQAGFVFLKQLSREYKGRILVQPFPYSSTYLAEREDWGIRRSYDDYLGFNRFLFKLRDAALREICGDLGVELLDPPDISWAAEGFTPRALMRDDGLHPLPEYGAMVLRQVTEKLSEACTAS
jgi:hypothetical protein